ncbi:MAG: hypothetical protein R3208_21135 [Ketobacteraceae bacterium]|nr:hypothetical protein [Ketobacteraceae bacterium]
MNNFKLLSIYIFTLLVLTGCGGNPEELCDVGEEPNTIYIDQNADIPDYPSYSRPIFSEGQMTQYVPNQSFASCLPRNLDDPGERPTSSSDNAATWVKASRFWYFPGETITAEADVIGLDASRFSSVSARLIVDEGNEVIATATGVKIPGTAHKYRLSFDNAGEFSIDNTKRMSIIAEFTVEDHYFEIGTSIEYYETVVTRLDSIGPAEVIAEHLEIPVYVSTTELGIHSVSANLYDAESGIPLVHLYADKDLTLESDVITLQAHIAALKIAGSEGPYVLKDFALTRKPSPPNYVTERGSVIPSSVAIPQFPFTEYNDIPYVP